MHTYSFNKTAENAGNTGSLANTTSAGKKRPDRLHVGIVGARGYSGMELGRSLLQHPYVEKLTLGLNETKIQSKHWVPEAFGREIQTVSVQQLVETAASLDVVFLATPAEVSMELAPALLSAGTKVVDISGAYRLNDPQKYPQWYGFEHKNPENLNTARYGLTPFHTRVYAEIDSNSNSRSLSACNSDSDSDSDSDLNSNKNLDLDRNFVDKNLDSTSTSQIKIESKKSQSCSLIANPGCYATAIQMALIPLLQQDLLDTKSIVIDAKSGTTGAGKKASEAQLFAEVEGECLPYKIGRHQHFPEICEHIEKIAKKNIDPLFSTTLIPVRRGIIAGIYAQLNEGMGLSDIESAYQKCYEKYPLVRFGHADSMEGSSLLSLKKVVGSARTHIAYAVEGKKLYLYSSIDNLMKGAATQAIENMNYLWGWPLHTGLLHREGLI